MNDTVENNKNQIETYRTPILVERIQNQGDHKINISMHETMIRLKSIRSKTLRNIILFIFIFITLVLIYYNQAFGAFLSHSHIYSIVIDAGSTGSRIHVYRFKKTEGSESMSYELLNEDLFHAIKPGLSSYADNPEEAANSLKPLLDMAKSTIPITNQKITRISLKATAGLRLLSETKANLILKTVEKLFEVYPFYKSKDDVSILDGKYEGIYSWITLNYAKESFRKNEETEICSLDLGGGSTQITFVVNKIDEKKYSEDLVAFKLDKKVYQIFAKSFLGYGLMSARLNMLKAQSKENSQNLSSVCLSNSYAGTWNQQNTIYTISGNKEKNKNYKDCYFDVMNLIESKLEVPTVNLIQKTIYAFSFYYDRLTSVNLVSEDGGEVRLQEIFKKAKEVCDETEPNKYSHIKESEFLCMDLTYIFSLLHDGFGLPLSKSILVHKHINKMEINWALGAAFHMLND